jgi:hypothetical protein
MHFLKVVTWRSYDVHVAAYVRTCMYAIKPPVLLIGGGGYIINSVIRYSGVAWHACVLSCHSISCVIYSIVSTLPLLFLTPPPLSLSLSLSPSPSLPPPSHSLSLPHAPCPSNCLLGRNPEIRTSIQDTLMIVLCDPWHVHMRNITHATTHPYSGATYCSSFTIEECHVMKYHTFCCQV